MRLCVRKADWGLGICTLLDEVENLLCELGICEGEGFGVDCCGHLIERVHCRPVVKALFWLALEGEEISPMMKILSKVLIKPGVSSP